ncbi:MAG: DUF58 domain-containing protein [Chloroflexi bacterium]|nr:MAG: DUF58 domain-containing protein [Chloroflexota bacterium]
MPRCVGARRPRSSPRYWRARRSPRRMSPRRSAEPMETHPLDARTGRFPWQAAVLFVAVAAISRAPALIVLAFGAVITWLVVEITGRLALAAVDARVTLTPDRIVAGELPVATVEIVNRKPVPLPWLEARLFLGEGVEPPDPAPGTPRGWIDCGFPIRGRERVVVRLPVRVPARGAYAIGPLRLRGGDWLGFTQTERTVAVAPEVIAYPAPLAVRDRALASLRPLAETATRRGLVPDPLRFRGVRPHRRGDARKEIHWKASARLRELQTKLYEPATSLDSIFLVNVASYEQYWIQADPEAAELVVSATAELVRLAAGAGRQVGLVTNGIDNLTHERPRSALGRGPRSLTRSLEILARLGPYAVGAPETVFLRERGRLPWGATLVIVTPRLGQGLANAAVALRRAHHRVLIVCVGDIPAALGAHLVVHGVSHDVLTQRERSAAV